MKEKENFLEHLEVSANRPKHKNDDIFAIRISDPKKFGHLLKKAALEEGVTMGRYLEKVMNEDFNKKGIV